MSQEADARPEHDDDEDIPFMQRLLDNHFLLLIIGVAVPTVFYIIWGIVEVAQLPVAN